MKRMILLAMLMILASTHQVHAQDTYGSWSSWTTTPATANKNLQVEKKTQYRYKDKSTTTSSSSTLSGWTYDSSTYTWSDYGSWSSWSKTSVTATDARKVETKTIAATYKTQYNYSRYASKSNNTGNLGPWKGKWSGVQCSYYFTKGWSDTKLVVCGTQQAYKSGVLTKFNLYNTSSTKTTNSWFNQTTRSVVKTAAYKQYRYATRSKIYTYHFYKWGDFSSWGDQSYTASSTRQVETRTVYRTRPITHALADGNATLAFTNTTYSGSYVYPSVTVKHSSTALSASSDYQVTYSNNVNVGTATVTITGKGNYTGSITKTFTINKASYDMSGVSFNNQTFKYDGKTKSIAISGSLPKGVTVTYKGNKQSKTGTYKVTATFSGDNNHYQPSSMSATMTIKKTSKAMPSISVSNQIKAVNTSSFQLKAKTSSQTKLTYKSSNNKIATVSKNGKVTLKKKCGTAVITIKSAGNSKYESGEKRITIKVVPPKTSISKIKATGSKGIDMAWKKVSSITEYEIQISKQKNFKKNTKANTYKPSKTKLKISGLPKGKVYVRIRTTKVVNHVRYTSQWSEVKSIKVK